MFFQNHSQIFPIKYNLHNPTCFQNDSHMFPIYPIYSHMFPIYFLSGGLEFSPRAQHILRARGASGRLTCSAQLRSGRIVAPRGGPGKNGWETYGKMVISQALNGDWIGFRWDFSWVLNGHWRVSRVMGDPENGCFLRENPMKMDDLKVPPFMETPQMGYMTFMDRNTERMG